MSVDTNWPEQDLAHVQSSAVPSIVPEAADQSYMDLVPMHSDSILYLADGGGPVSEIPTVEEAISGVTDVQRPFSLANHDVERKDRTSDAPLLVKRPKGGLLRLGFAACDLAGGSWQLLPFSFVLPQLPADFAGTFDRIYSGGGLVLMEKFVKQQYLLVVSNPASKSQRQLPPMMEFSKPEILGIFVDYATASYRIPVVQRKYNEKEMDLVLLQEYDSISNSWEFSGQWRNRFQVEPIGAVYVNDTLFFLTYDQQAHVEGRQQRVHHIYYLNDDVWERLELPLGLGFPTIFEFRGKLMLAGGLHDFDLDNGNGSNAVQSVRIWEHEWSLMRWKEVCNMPGSWVNELYKCAPEGGRCTLEVTAGGNFVCVSSSNRKVTKCDITKNDWAWLSKCDLPKYADGGSMLLLDRRPDIFV